MESRLEGDVVLAMTSSWRAKVAMTSTWPTCGLRQACHMLEAGCRGAGGSQPHRPFCGNGGSDSIECKESEVGDGGDCNEGGMAIPNGDEAQRASMGGGEPSRASTIRG